jgi:hypothetical protein
MSVNARRLRPFILFGRSYNECVGSGIRNEISPGHIGHGEDNSGAKAPKPWSGSYARRGGGTGGESRRSECDSAKGIRDSHRGGISRQAALVSQNSSSLKVGICASRLRSCCFPAATDSHNWQGCRPSNVFSSARGRELEGELFGLTTAHRTPSTALGTPVANKISDSAVQIIEPA